jgi:hypothetical protein
MAQGSVVYAARAHHKAASTAATGRTKDHICL